MSLSSRLRDDGSIKVTFPTGWKFLFMGKNRHNVWLASNGYLAFHSNTPQPLMVWSSATAFLASCGSYRACETGKSPHPGCPDAAPLPSWPSEWNAGGASEPWEEGGRLWALHGSQP